MKPWKEKLVVIAFLEGLSSDSDMTQPQVLGAQQ